MKNKKSKNLVEVAKIIMGTKYDECTRVELRIIEILIQKNIIETFINDNGRKDIRWA